MAALKTGVAFFAGSLAPTGFVNATVQCGSGLARDGGVSVDIHVECEIAFAGKPRSYRGSAVWRRLRYVDVIQHPIHRQLGQHDDLLNRQERMPLRCLDIRGNVAGHDAR